MTDLPEERITLRVQVNTYGEAQDFRVTEEMVAAAMDAGVWVLVFEEPFTVPETFWWVVQAHGFRPYTDGPVLGDLDLYSRWRGGMLPIGWLF